MTIETYSNIATNNQISRSFESYRNGTLFSFVTYPLTVGIYHYTLGWKKMLEWAGGSKEAYSGGTKRKTPK